MAVDVDPHLFATAFEQLRLARGWSPAEVARRLGADPTEVSRWRRGLGGIGIRNVRKIADLFAVDRGYLEQLAGFEPSGPADDDPELTAYVEQFKAAVRGVPRTFRGVVTQAAVGLAASLAQHTAEGPVSAPESGGVSAPIGRLTRGASPSRSRLTRSKSALQTLLALPAVVLSDPATVL